MNSGFRGTRIGVSELVLRDGHINYEIQFVDSDGVVHGRMRHSRPYDAESELGQKADALLTALIDEAARMHFTSAASLSRSDLTTGGTPGGIAEAMGAAAGAPDEPEGAPG